MRGNGFTLVELLVSLFIFGLLSAAGVALLSVGVRAQETAGAHLDRLAQVRRASALLAGDLAQAAPRPFRDAAGLRRAAFSGEGVGSDAPFLVLVRRGWENYDGAPRPSLQKVAYRLSGGRLERIAYPYVDGSEPLLAVPLLDNVRALQLRYRDRRGEWRERWDPANATELPVAVELAIDAGEAAPLRQLFLAGAAQ